MKKKYLLDTCICIHFLQNRPEVVNKILQIGWDKCCIAEATIGELLCGVRDDGRKARKLMLLNLLYLILKSFLPGLQSVNMQDRKEHYDLKDDQLKILIY